ncbi:PREDICTED: interferon-induced very large GTPase 1-like [Dipodomys ordii]|uniref:Interferon-induced very large GTPase 1-like n=1 Tax=Dipodomys ordii TaxID=10020 RepID=A0A1S3GU68_DIPOR|nr:PREDICTED: interferon-induced very large GTPase 1-like [Dipodomys ordii]
MDSEESNTDSLLKGKRRQDLQELLTEVGLSVEYWLPKLQQHLGVSCAQALQYLEEKDLQKLKSQVQHSWEKKALEKLIDLAQSNSMSALDKSPVQMIRKRQKQAEQTLEELKDLLLEGRCRQEEAVRRKESELREVMEIPEQYWPLPEQPLSKVVESIQTQLSLTVQTLSHRQNLPDRDVVRRASGGLALQGIYKTSHQMDLIQKREELLSVPKEFLLHGPEQGTRMETREFTSSHTESMFTRIIETLGFRVAASSKGEGWGFNLEAGVDGSTHSESKETQQSSSKKTYFCSSKFSYIPLASCHFPMDQLQLSKAAFQELKTIEKLLSETSDSDKLQLLRQRTENFFLRFGSHANQGPLHLGGIYWWKATAEGFQSHQMAEVKHQAAEALDIYIRGSYNGFGVKVAAEIDRSHSHSECFTERKSLQNLQTTLQLSVAQTGGPTEADGLVQWKAGLVASNQTWHVIDRGLHLVPIWDIILSHHRGDFKDPLQVATWLKDSYVSLTGLVAQIQDGEELLSAEKEVREFLEDVKSWEVSDPEKQLKQLMDFMQLLSHKMKSYDIWIKLCLTDWDLQNFLLNTFNFCKKSSMYNTKFIKSQLCSLLDPHVYKVTNFPQAHSIMQWIYQSEADPEHVNITQFSQFIKILREIQNNLMEMNVKSESTEIVKEAQRKATYEVSMALSCFLNFLKRTEQTDKYILLLSIAAGAGYQLTNGIFLHLLTCDELKFLLEEMQTALNKYQELKNVSNHKAQAFLLLTGLTTTAGCIAISPEEKIQRLASMKQHMGQSLSNEVVHILDRHGVDHDWVNLENGLRLLTDGNYEIMNPSWKMNEVKRPLERHSDEQKHPDPLQRKENNNKDVMKNVAFLDLLQRLGLEHYYPKKMNRDNFHLIYKTSVYNNQPKSQQELPFYFLQKLLVLDCGLRHLDFKNEAIIENLVSTSTSIQENEDFNPYEDFPEDPDTLLKRMTTIHRSSIHPMDIQMAIFHCVDDLARQYILAKLSICQYALPLLVPNPCTSEIEFSLWSLRKIRRSWQHANKSPQGKKSSYKNQQMCQVSTSIVSFIRVGNGLSASKSLIMNCLLSKRKHDVFFHRHSRGSSKDCLLMGGVVEICWFCPAGEEEDRFDNCVAFTNLHGDAKEHRRQLAFLQKVSSLIVILMSASDKNEENQKIVLDLCKSSRPLICLLDDREKTMASNSGRRVKIGIRNRNEAELTEELTMTIRHLLEISDTALSLEDCSLTAHKEGFLVDEDQRDCMEAKEKAWVIMALLGETNLSHIKENFLPLQGQLWHNWCKKDKELYHLREKGNKSIEHHKSQIETEKQTIRRKQLEKAIILNDVMKSVLQILQQHSEIHTKLYFLQWLSLFLENLTAGTLEKLHECQRTLWSQIKTEKHKAQMNKSLKPCVSLMEAISKEIQDCALGIEQFLREVGQIYEALEETSYTRDILFLSLPQIAADLMVSGVPIELMDGDASYVPLKWVSAVFDKVSEKLGDPRIFVLSVLGLQSSGKSTLLNALFGLQFTVSAGRCTRGVYMQLLKVEETFTEELGFDFVLVVDTEGLRAPELNNKSQNWDNELATFVIGLGNLTIINIFGENPSEMQDILQIVVQAFLRMKQVKITPSCFFVHQNVGEVAAEDQTMEGRRRLEQKLDEMTALAAEQEECSHITRFSDVIKFDASSHIYYFAHLWDGNPPMAPPNPRYSHNVQELKSRILSTAKQENRGNILKISHMKSRVQDLWRALVSENFIFNFKNTREIMAMAKLETKYNQWTWLLRSHQMNLQTQLTNQVKNGKLVILNTSIIVDPLTEVYQSIKQSFQKYFTEDPDSEIIIQWKANFENKLVILKETLISDTKREINELIALKKSQERLDQKKIGYETELLKRSQKLALTLKGKELSEEELHERFNQLWKNWVCDILSNLPQVTEPNIDVDRENILLDYFKKEKHIREELNQKSRKTFEIDDQKHVQLKGKWNRWFKSLEVSDNESIKVTTKRIISRFEETVKNIERQKCDYNPNDFHEILRLIDEEVKSEPNEKYTFTSNYNLDLSLHLSQRASEIFKERHRAFKEANDPVKYLESKKDELFLSFKISCQGAISITTFANFLWQKLTPAISNTIWGKMPLKIAEYLRSTCPAFNGNRAKLEKHILISLAEEENFDNYWQYIHDPKSFCSSYIQNHIKQYCFNEGVEKIKTFIQISLGDIKNAILSAIHESTEVAKDKSSTASEWLDLFCDHLGNNLIFPRRDLVNIEHQEIKDTEFLKEAMSKPLDLTMKDIGEKLSGLPIHEMVPKIEEILSEHLCGCWKQCPMCKAICTNTIPNHDGDHSVPFHRPEAVNGQIWSKTDNFVINSCSTSVASDDYMVLDDDREVLYKNYRQAGGDFATWSITADLSSQPYWKWFISHFRSNLEEKYKYKFKGKGEIPNTWLQITKQDVLNDLKK